VKEECLFIEFAGLMPWFKEILPRLTGRPGPIGWVDCYIYDCNPFVLPIIVLTGLFAKIKIKIPAFSISEIRDPEGTSVRLRVLYHDLFALNKSIEASSAYRRFYRDFGGCARLGQFLSKALVIPYHFIGSKKYSQSYHALMLIRVSSWIASKNRVATGGILLFLNERPFTESLNEYAQRHGLRLSFCPLFKRGWDIGGIIKKIKTIRPSSFLPILINKVNAGHTISRTEASRGLTSGIENVKMAVAYYGHFNLDRPECFSDLFFLQNNRELSKKTIITFNLPQDPLDNEKLKKLRGLGISPLVLSDYAVKLDCNRNRIKRYTAPRIKVNEHPYSFSSIDGFKAESEFFKSRVSEYLSERKYWLDLCSRNNIKLYLSWYNCDLGHMAQSDALGQLGGLVAIYQRSYEQLPCVETRVSTDVLFGFSRMGADIERESGSRISYYVVTGYLGDYRFQLLKKKAQDIRSSLRAKGVRQIISFLDENTLSDSRWFTGDNFTQKNYEFLFERLLRNPWLGLVCKPKTPGTLRRRLGAVSHLMDEALDSGRCFIFSDGVIQGAYPPAAAALASDLSIHEVLSAGTAGIEAALSGVKTLLLDREGWTKSPLYRLGKDKVVFDDLETMWKACEQHFVSSSGIPGFGEWNGMLKEFDPFRDGRAAERMGGYLGFLINRLDSKVPRETALAEAAQEYARVWGKDKVIEIQ